MGKKILLNTVCNIIIFAGAIGCFEYGFEQKNYGYAAAALVMMAIAVVLKIKIYKDLKQAQKPK